MKKLFYLLLLILFIITGCENDIITQVDMRNTIDLDFSNNVTEKLPYKYYWYNGKKIELTPVYDKSYILIDANVRNGSSFINVGKFNSLDADLSCVDLFNTAKSQNLKWGIMENSFSTKITDLDGVVYHSPFYKICDAATGVGISNLFYVKLKTKDDFIILEKFANKYNVEILGNNKFLPLWYTLSCDKESVGDAIDMANVFYESGLFTFAQPDIMGGIINASVPSDTYYSSQWNLHGNYSINWENANSLATGSGIKVTVIDSGIESLHPDFTNVYQLYDADSNSFYVSPIIDSDPHGTNCAGIIAAKTNNNRGIASVAPNAQLYSVTRPTIGSSNFGQKLASCITVAVNSTDILNCSWATDNVSDLIDDALYSGLMWGRDGKGCIIVFASGNDVPTIKYPANSNSKLLVVGATTNNGRRKSNSTYGLSLDVVAPGVNIPTTDLLGLVGSDNIRDYNLNFGGTSAACAHVAGIAALILSVNPSLTNIQVNDIIESTAKKVGGYSYTTTTDRTNGTWNIEMGYGLVDAYDAVMEAINY